MTPLPRILVITDRTQARTAVENVVRDICGSAGTTWILLRERDLPPRERRNMAKRLRVITNECGARLSVSGDAELAAEVGAEGLHVQKADQVAAARVKLPGVWIGVSTHNLAEVRAAKDAGADYVTLSPIFPTESKPGYGPSLGLETIRAAAEIGIPIFALGGVTPRSARACLDAGAHGLAIMGTVMRAENPRAVIRQYAEAFATCSLRTG